MDNNPTANLSKLPLLFHLTYTVSPQYTVLNDEIPTSGFVIATPSFCAGIVLHGSAR